MNTISKVLIGLATAAILSISCWGQKAPTRSPSAATSTKSAQTQKAARPCTLTQASLPKIGGLQMGATYDEVLSVHPEIADDKFFQKRLEEENSGGTTVKVSSIFDEPKRERPAEVSLFFTDRVLSVIAVGGEDLGDFKSVHEAVASYSTFLGVDRDQWAFHYGYAGILKCFDFSFYANSYSEEYRMTGNSISIHADVKVKE